MSFHSVAILGLGLIGGSLAKALAERGTRARGYDPAPHPDAHGVVDIHETPQQAVAGAELVILAAPIPALAALAEAIAPHLAEAAIVTDVASVKMPLITQVKPLFPAHAALVPGHPIAGSEQGGFAAARADLFTGKRVILTPEDPHAPAVAPVAEFWRGLSAQVDFMPPELHDRVYAAVSHLPQALAFAYGELLRQNNITLTGDETTQRFLRLARSPAPLWQGIFAANAQNLAQAKTEYLRLLRQITFELGEGGEETPAPAAPEALYGALLPRILASCLAAVAASLEDETGISAGRYAGAGFRDFTAPLATAPEPHLEAISAHARQVRAALAEFAGILRGER